MNRTIGPAIRCGKRATNVEYSRMSFVGSTRFRQTSIVYDIELNV